MEFPALSIKEPYHIWYIRWWVRVNNHECKKRRRICANIQYLNVRFWTLNECKEYNLSGFKSMWFCAASATFISMAISDSTYHYRYRIKWMEERKKNNMKNINPKWIHPYIGKAELKDTDKIKQNFIALFLFMLHHTATHCTHQSLSVYGWAIIQCCCFVCNKLQYCKI